MCKPDYAGPLVTPPIIAGNVQNWRALADPNGDRDGPRMPRVEERSFFVDFELASPHDVLVGAPPVNMWSKSGRTQRESSQEKMIFMVGCGQMVGGKWKHCSFVAKALTVEAEQKMIGAWIDHMKMMPARGDSAAPLYINGGPTRTSWKRRSRSACPRIAPLPS